jgi:exonuclease I
MNFGRSIDVLAYDYETTGLDTASCGVLQAALIIVKLHQDGSYEILDKDCQLLNPGVEITAEATAIHGYSMMDVADKPCWIEYMTEQFDTVNALKVDAVFGYNNYSYDDKISMRVGWKPVFSIDMIKPCRALKKLHGWEGAKLVQSYEKLLGKPMEKAHDALADVTATLDLVAPAIKAAGLNSLDELIAWATKDEGTPNMTINFGKHKGSKLKNLEKDYVQWLLTKCEVPFSHDLRKGLQACLA